MKVCLVRPATITTAEAVGEDAAPPLGIAYLAATLLQCGHQVTVVDALGEALHRYSRVAELPTGLRHGLSNGEIIDRIPSDTEAIGVSMMFSLEWPFTRDLLFDIRKAFPSATIIAGGEHITALPEFSLNTCGAIDYCVLGEGEQTLVDLLEALTSGHDRSEVHGLCFRTNEGTARTVSRRRLRQLDEIPRPAWDLVPIEAYLSHGVMTGVDYGRSMPMLASRGCPYRCTFCSNPVMWGPVWRARSPEDVADELQDYMVRYRAQNFDFYDLTAIVKRSWIVDFCRVVIDRKFQITWQLPSGTRSEAIDEEVCRLLYQSGCRYVNYAPESGSEEILKRIKKQIKKATMTASIRGALEAGLNVKCNFILGFPGEQLRHVKDTYRWIATLAWAGVHDVSVFPFSPYPGSELFVDLIGAGRIELNDSYFYSLSQYTDPRYMRSYCENFSARLLRVLCLAGMAMFYAVSSLRFPARILQVASYVRHNDAKTKLAAALIRVRKKREQLRVGQPNVPSVIQ
jgi:anaerobic magnesium-protoporphyrin IX monomethyl ester cyclase